MAEKVERKKRNKNVNKTFSVSPAKVERKWYVVDAADLVLGRMSVVIADYLRGKHKAIFTPNQDTGDFVIVLNADKVYLTGDKEKQKLYRHHTNYPGGLKEIALKDLRKKKPEKVIEEAVSKMITRNPLGRKVLKKLFVYAGNEHNHSAQKPEILDVGSLNPKNIKRN
ncbi:MAG: 50S ribosomal protein L13 [Rickettsiales bacterium]|jgi:large subunit ribosomal protein L13|nr:50S ribosomal protein L13 [Rickettsiales bacterium]